MRSELDRSPATVTLYPTCRLPTGKSSRPPNVSCRSWQRHGNGRIARSCRLDSLSLMIPDTGYPGRKRPRFRRKFRLRFHNSPYFRLRIHWWPWRSVSWSSYAACLWKGAHIVDGFGRSNSDRLVLDSSSFQSGHRNLYRNILSNIKMTQL